MKLLGLPREVGKHPESQEMITAGLGRFGPYLKMGNQYKTLPPDDDILNVGLNRAVVLLAEPSKGNRPQREPGKALGEHPDDGKAVTLNTGRFGPYVKWGKVMATVTKSYDPETLTLKEALEIIEAKIAKGPSKFGKAAKTAKAAKAEKPVKSENPVKAAKPEES